MNELGQRVEENSGVKLVNNLVLGINMNAVAEASSSARSTTCLKPSC
jgi:3-hydroxyisobutyrate dehydrogenase-like beta-hydroxyacid dehydrogenase